MFKTEKHEKEDGKDEKFHSLITLYGAALSRFFARDFFSIDPSGDLQSLYWRYIDEHPLMLPEASEIAFLDFNSFFPTNKTWILRNLTTREFVVSNSIALKKEYIHGPFIQGLGFYEVILMRICLTTSPNLSIHNKHNIHQGKWAGHSLDIVPIDDLENEDGSWKDISDEIAREIAEVWEENMGRNWRQHVMVNVGEWWPALVGYVRTQFQSLKGIASDAVSAYGHR
ncbi:hypothetical protein VTN49DRAFT_262 [Thermomyces lanuginosus]|uniref:uncharacterized protein n=1 Tax=Thermomyces lanuginosus TaxID=5541 RepID=UPI0037444AB8